MLRKIRRKEREKCQFVTKIIIVPDLPKTRSGKFMHRIMHEISSGEGDQLGDLSTLANPSVVDAIKAKVALS